MKITTGYLFHGFAFSASNVKKENHPDGGKLLTADIVACLPPGTGVKTKPSIRQYVNDRRTFVPSSVNSSFTYLSDNGELKCRWIECSNPELPGTRWTAGHAIARMSGGPCDTNNIFPQNADMNHKRDNDFVIDSNVNGAGNHSWVDFETKLNRKLQKYGEVNVAIHFKP